jgi:dCTP deaminase
MNHIIHGVLPDHEIEGLIDNGTLCGANKNRIQPASIDLSPDLNTLMKLKYFTIPKKGECIENLISDLRKQGAAKDATKLTLDTKEHYLVRLKESFNESLYGRANPKSSTGRTFNHSRMICDRTSVIDELPADHSGNIWMLITPKFFPVTLSEIESLNQLRFFNGDARLSDHELRRMLVNNPDLVKIPEGQMENNVPVEVIGNTIGEILISVDLKNKCYRTIHNIERPLGLNERNVPFTEYYEEIDPDEMKDGLILEEGRGYLIATVEQVSIPENMAAEVMISNNHGEIQIHLAG